MIHFHACPEHGLEECGRPNGPMHDCTHIPREDAYRGRWHDNFETNTLPSELTRLRSSYRLGQWSHGRSESASENEQRNLV